MPMAGEGAWLFGERGLAAVEEPLSVGSILLPPSLVTTCKGAEIMRNIIPRNLSTSRRTWRGECTPRN